MSKLSKFIFAVSLLSSFSAFAKPLSNHHVLVAPKCLTKDFSVGHKVLASNDNLSLIETNKTGFEALLELRQQVKTKDCGGFVDVTDFWKVDKSQNLTAKQSAKQFLTDYTVTETENKFTAPPLRNNKQVSQLMSKIDGDAMWDRLVELSSAPDRFANSNTGEMTALELQSEVEKLAATYSRSDVSTRLVATGSRYKQKSVVVKIGNSDLPAVVIGAHMDTLRNNKPGADDDGTGTVTLLEAAKVVLSSEVQFKRPVYFIWYAAEEMGLVGSNHVVKDFVSKNIPVLSVMQLDMTGYAYQNDLTMWLLKDYVDQDLTNYVESLIDAYVGRPVKYTTCGYACSDHASWTLKGFSSSAPFESKFGTENPFIHSSQDTIEKLSLDHMKDYAKLAVAYITELAEPLEK